MMIILFHDLIYSGSEVDVHNERRRFDVSTASTERLCFASPGGDHARATTVLRDCSSPSEHSLKLSGSSRGHSSNLKELTCRQIFVKSPALGS